MKWLQALEKSPPAILLLLRGLELQFLAAWKTEYPWVTYGHAEGMCCQYCIDAEKKSTFTKSCDKYLKNDLAKHALTVDHRAAIEAKSCRQDMQLQP